MSREIAFFGTPAFAVPSLEALCEAGRRPGLVVSQPARPAGRGHALQQPPVARRALALGLSLEQPARLSELRERLFAAPPWVAVVVAYGKLFPEWLLALPEKGCVNLHASLLPRWRGAAPIHAAIAAGDATSGVTTMLMEAGLDTGPTLLRETLPVGAEETEPELAVRLARLGAALLVETVDRLEAGTLEAEPQPTSGVTHAPRITKPDGQVDWRLPAAVLYARYRAYVGWPGLTASLAGRPLRITACRMAGTVEASSAGGEPGEILVAGPEALSVVCGERSILLVTRVQRPGKRELAIDEFLNGEPLAVGDRFDRAASAD
jgi:methionyl-tRNA formyltransferase